MGETLPIMFDRIDHMVFDQMPMLFGKQFETPSKIILDRVYITTAGAFSTSAFLCALTSFSADRILFSVDYPYSSAAPAKRWLDSLPVSQRTGSRSLTQTRTGCWGCRPAHNQDHAAKRPHP